MSSISNMEKLEQRITTLTLPITIDDVFTLIAQIFQIPLHTLPGLTCNPNEQLATYLATNQQTNITAKQLTEQINQLYGVNLQALSLLEHAAISLYSKGHWILRQPTDVIEVYTDMRDIEVIIIPSAYWIEKTGSVLLPPALINGLSSLGYKYYEANEVTSFYNDAITGLTIPYCYYVDPDKQPVADSFKGKTMQHIMNAFRT